MRIIVGQKLVKKSPATVRRASKFGGYSADGLECRDTSFMCKRMLTFLV